MIFINYPQSDKTFIVAELDKETFRAIKNLSIGASAYPFMQDCNVTCTDDFKEAFFLSNKTCNPPFIVFVFINKCSNQGQTMHQMEFYQNEQLNLMENIGTSIGSEIINFMAISKIYTIFVMQAITYMTKRVLNKHSVGGHVNPPSIPKTEWERAAQDWANFLRDTYGVHVDRI